MIALMLIMFSFVVFQSEFCTYGEGIKTCICFNTHGEKIMCDDEA